MKNDRPTELVLAFSTVSSIGSIFFGWSWSSEISLFVDL